MRIISGKVRGMKLVTPPNEDIRPTTDRVKEAMFSIINPYIYDAIVIDLFSGTGSLGLEALSRGAEFAFFSDLNKTSLKITESNIKKAKFEAKSKIFNLSFEDMINKMSREKVKADIIFVDPPYFEGLFDQILHLIDEKGILDDEGILVIEHDNSSELPSRVGRLGTIKEKKYGKTGVTIMKLEEMDE